MFKELIDNVTSNKDDSNIDILRDRYQRLSQIQARYTKQLNFLMEEREIEKRESFQSSLLNIKLKKFSGYDAPIDLYSFKTDFEKSYIKMTPSELLPDLLKNNFLDGKALTLVKNVDNIEEIWRRLKESYGDCKMLLSKKLSELSKIDISWKSNDSSKVIDNLSKIINIMKDVMNLAKVHKLENDLYYGNHLHEFYKRLLIDDLVKHYIKSHGTILVFLITKLTVTKIVIATSFLVTSLSPFLTF